MLLSSNRIFLVSKLSYKQQDWRTCVSYTFVPRMVRKVYGTIP